MLIIFLQLFGLRLVTVDRVPLDLCLDHLEDAVGILTLLLVSQVGLRRIRRRDSLDMTDSDDASWSISESKDATHVEDDLLVLRQLTLWRTLVLERIVKLVKAVQGRLQLINYCVIGTEDLTVLSMLFGSLLGRIVN